MMNFLLIFVIQSFYFLHESFALRSAFDTVGDHDVRWFPAQSCVEMFQVQIKANSDAFIILAEDENNLNRSYEIIIGGWDNTQSRLSRNNVEKVMLDTPSILSGDEYRGFWVRWDHGVIAVGREEQTMPFMILEDEFPLSVDVIGVSTSHGFYGHWYVDTLVTGSENQQYRFYPVEGSVNFLVEAANDVFVALASSNSFPNPMYEIIIGGWHNTKSTIKRYKADPHVIEANTPGILHGNEFRGFWIKWDNGSLVIGKEGELKPFMSWRDPKPFKIEYVGFKTKQVEGWWILDNYSNCTQDKLLEFADQYKIFYKQQSQDYQRVLQLLWYGKDNEINELKTLLRKMAWKPTNEPM